MSIDSAVLTHLERISAKDPRMSVKLLRSEVLDFTEEAMERQADQSHRTGKHAYEANVYSDIYLIVSAVPALHSWEAMTYFDGGYLQCVLGLADRFRFNLDSRDFAHWIVCFDGSIPLAEVSKIEVHLSYFLVDKSNAMLAQDLLSPAEKYAFRLE